VSWSVLADRIDAHRRRPRCCAGRRRVADRLRSPVSRARPGTIVAAASATSPSPLDPIAASLQESADDAIAMGLLDPVDLAGIYDLTLAQRAARGAR
jgi:hypothetical protein